MRRIIEVLSIKKKQKKRSSRQNLHALKVPPVHLTAAIKMTKRVNLFFKFWIWPLIYTFFIFFLSSLHVPISKEIGFFQLDKFLHVIEYSILGYLLVRAFKNSTALKYKKIFLYVVVIGFLIGNLDELYQLFIPYREASLLDIISDLVGICVGLIIFRKVKPW